MSEPIHIKLEKKPRLKFIDMARSIAILLMLEGHFVDHTLGTAYRDAYPLFDNPDFFWFDVWLKIRGYTSPMFLTMTGLVFTYLLYLNNSQKYLENKRVSKGFKRVLELLFWGYLLSPNSFHVLQCIGFGIAGILVIYGLYKIIRFIPLWVYFFALSTFLFCMFSYMTEHYTDTNGNRVGWPVGAPDFFQNMFWAPSNRSLFPFMHNLGYTYFGAGLGVLLHSVWINKHRWSIPLFLSGIGVFFVYFSTPVFVFIQNTVKKNIGLDFIHFQKANWIYETLGWVLIVLSILSLIERLITIKDNLFIRIGQNTLSIFVIHMIILYGAIVRYIAPIHLGHYFERTRNPLNPLQAAIGAALFITLFVLMIKYIKPLTELANKFLDIVIPIRKRTQKGNKS